MTTKPDFAHRDLNAVIDALRHTEGRERKCTLLIGAGCSLSAGIPLAGKIVADIRAQFPAAYERARKRNDPPGYGQCMRELAPGPRQDFLKKYLDAARINWAHIGLAQLVKHGLVDRILTTNFDPLIARACALVNEFPAIYDLTTSTNLRAEDLPHKAVFHLHGQRDGFVLLDETEELERHARELGPLSHAREGRVWIVVGYSGENDPLFKLIRDIECYRYELFWVDIHDQPSPAMSDFFTEKRCAYHVHEPRGADMLFMTLAHRLDAWPPTFVDQPFEHLRQQLESIIPQETDGSGRQIDWLAQAREKIDRAEACLSSQADARPEERIGEIQAKFLDSGGEAAAASSESNDLKASLLAWEASQLDDKAVELAKTNLTGARMLWQQAGNLYQQALAIKPDMHEADNNWGVALANEARALAPSDLPAARKLWRQVAHRYEQTLSIMPDMHEAANNWGSALDYEARALAPSDLPAARKLWRQAAHRYQQALAIKPDMHEATSNWGGALLHEFHAMNEANPEAAKSLLDEAKMPLRLAESIKPGSGAYNLACVYARCGKVADCIQWLNTARTHGALQTAAHIREDNDIAPLRHTPEFTTWWREVFGPDEPLET